MILRVIFIVQDVNLPSSRLSRLVTEESSVISISVSILTPKFFSSSDAERHTAITSSPRSLS